MDQKSPLISGYLNFGLFEDFHIKLPLSRRSRRLINAFIKLVVFISAVKLFVIVACTWKPLKLYLIETYVFDERQQRVLDIGLDIVHIGHLISFSYWTSLNKNLGQLKCFDFLFVSNFETLCKFYQRRYQLDQKATELFLSKYHLFTSFLRPIQVSYACFLVGCVLRCTYKSFYAIGPVYFLHFGIILTAITSMAWILVVYFSISKYGRLVFDTFKSRILNLETLLNRICFKNPRTPLKQKEISINPFYDRVGQF